jgi:hypothetical protein
MLKRQKIIFCIVLVALSTGLISFICTRASEKKCLAKAELLDYIADNKNGLIKSDSSTSVHYSLCYRPAELITQSKSLVFDEQNLVKGDTLEFIHFILKASYKNNDLLVNPNVPYDYGQVLNNLSFGLQKFIYAVIDKKDTISLSESIYARNYGMTKASSALLSFKPPSRFENCEIKVRDFVFGTNQQISFRFKSNDFKNCPVLKP